MMTKLNRAWIELVVLAAAGWVSAAEETVAAGCHCQFHPRSQNVEGPALLLDGEEPVALFGATDGYQKNGRIAFNVHIPLNPKPQP